MIYYVKFRLFSQPFSAFFQARGLQTTTRSQIQPISYLFMACELRMVFPFLNGCFRLFHKLLHSILDFAHKAQNVFCLALEENICWPLLWAPHFYPGMQISRKKYPALLSGGLSINKRDGKVRKKKRAFTRKVKGKVAVPVIFLNTLRDSLGLMIILHGP